MDEIVAPTRKNTEMEESNKERAARSVIELRAEIDLETQKLLDQEATNEVFDECTDDNNRCVDGQLDEPEPKETDKEISTRLGYNRFMITDIWKHRNKMLEKDNIKASRQSANERKSRKQAINRTIIT